MITKFDADCTSGESGCQELVFRGVSNIVAMAFSLTPLTHSVSVLTE